MSDSPSRKRTFSDKLPIQSERLRQPLFRGGAAIADQKWLKPLKSDKSICFQ